MVNVTNFIKQNLGTIGAGVGGAALGGVVGYAAGSAGSSKKRKRRRVKARTRRTRSSTYKRVRRTPRTAGKRKDTSHRRIRYTKNGQPYVILGSGKARFIKKTGARRSHRKKGGRY
jgi:hypothetical protein